MPVIDSNLLIRLDKKDPTAERVLARLADEPLIVPFQAALEYAVGTVDPGDSIAVLERSFQVAAPTLETLEVAATLAGRTRSHGYRVQSGDAWIAAEARLRMDFVVTSNKRDFRRLDVSAWNYMREAEPPVV